MRLHCTVHVEELHVVQALPQVLSSSHELTMFVAFIAQVPTSGTIRAPLLITLALTFDRHQCQCQCACRSCHRELHAHFARNVMFTNL